MLATLRHLVLRFTERFFDWRFGISSDTQIDLREFGITDAAFHPYNATTYLRFRQLMKLVPIRAGEDVFLDFGSGLGRVVILAATYPFRKVIGVELIPELHAKAQDNVRKALPRLKCQDIELHNIDARSFKIPAEVTGDLFLEPVQPAHPPGRF